MPSVLACGKQTRSAIHMVGTHRPVTFLAIIVLLRLVRERVLDKADERARVEGLRQQCCAQRVIVRNLVPQLVGIGREEDHRNMLRQGVRSEHIKEVDPAHDWHLHI